MRATNVGNKGHFKEEVTLGLLIKDGRKFEEEEGLSRTGEGRGGKGKTNTKSHECKRVRTFMRSPMCLGTGCAGMGGKW